LLLLISCFTYFSALKMEATFSFEMSGFLRPMRR
jgi:hypothetical protein